MPFFVIILIVPVLLLKTPPQAIGVANIASSDSSHRIDITRAHHSIGRKDYFLTEVNVVCTYLGLMVLPINQNLDYDYPITHQWDDKTAMGGVFVLFILGIACAAYKASRIISFGIFWFFIALSVESSFIPIGDVIAEYRLYLASVGFFLLVATWIYTRGLSIKKLNIMAAIILISFSALTFQRNNIWKSEFSLWNDTVQKSPHKARPYLSRGFIYYNQGNMARAIADYSAAIKIDPRYADAYYNRGNAYFQEGNLREAIADYDEAIIINPQNEDEHTNLGLAYSKQGNFLAAISEYTKAISINPDDAVAYYNRGLSHYKKREFSQAVTDYNKALKMDPTLGEKGTSP